MLGVLNLKIFKKYPAINRLLVNLFLFIFISLFLSLLFIICFYLYQNLFSIVYCDSNNSNDNCSFLFWGCKITIGIYKILRRVKNYFYPQTSNNTPHANPLNNNNDNNINMNENNNNNSNVNVPQVPRTRPGWLLSPLAQLLYNISNPFYHRGNNAHSQSNDDDEKRCD